MLQFADEKKDLTERREVRGQQSFDPAVAIEKLLGRAERCLMQFLEALQHAKASAELCVQRLRIIADNLKPTALFRTLWSERAYQYVPARLHGLGYLADIGEALIRGGKKMKHGTVVPYIVSARWKIGFSNVGSEPRDALRRHPQALFSHFNRG
jgi:hypothetical protein